MNGAGVRAVQKALVTAGLKVPQNGDYDAATAAAVARFQQANGLNVDGVVDPATRGKLGIPEQPAPSGAKPRAN
jgi:peptidoglycan hydrolase-like protein with peptidoglycan-binding domain